MKNNCFRTQNSSKIQHSLYSLYSRIYKNNCLSYQHATLVLSAMSSATVSSVPAPTIYQIKIVLVGIEPPIWRTVLCKSDATLAEFHDVIQVAMGWNDSHLHKFNVEDREIGNAEFRLDDYCDDAEDEREITLEDVAPSFEYEYDFGDGWVHDVHIEKEVPYNAKVSYPLCIAGERKCPPEDSGGVWGYQSTLDALADGTIDDDRREWMEEFTGGEPWDAEEFNLEMVNWNSHATRWRMA